MLEFRISHFASGYAGPELVKTYSSPGDVVLGPFAGDWYDAAQIYRKWAVTAPWSAKGPIHAREDFPKWLAQAPYWTIASLGDEKGVESEIEKADFFNVPGTVHAYDYYFAMHQDDRYPEMFPPKLGSNGLKAAIRKLHDKNMRVVPYVNGLLWDRDTESFRTEHAQNAAILNPNGNVISTDSYGFGQHLVFMCPGSSQWRDKITQVSKELVGRYGFDGVYFDFCTVQTSDCYNQEHGHPITGGNFWTKSVRALYSQVRTEVKKVNPEAILCGESAAEYVIDLLDTSLEKGKIGTQAPLYAAVYHGYTLVYGGSTNAEDSAPCNQGRWWLMGHQNGWHDVEGKYAKGEDAESREEGQYYRKLLRCYYLFGQPYLVYGRMLRPPKVEGELPMVTGNSTYGPYTVPVVEGTAWQAPDGTVGIFFLNYGSEPREFHWSVDLKEGAGWDADRTIKLSQWNEDGNTSTMPEVGGGHLTRMETIDGHGLLAFKLEVIK